VPDDDELEFEPSRIFDLPPVKELNDFLKSTIDDVSFVKEEQSTPQKPRDAPRKRRISSSDDSDDNLQASIKEIELDKLIEKKVESKLMKFLKSTSSEQSTSSKNDDDDDVVVVTPKKKTDDIIEID
jgi:hypothetical protein